MHLIESYNYQTYHYLHLLQPGEALTLTLEGPYFVTGSSLLSSPFTVTDRIYAQVDSANATTGYGAVLETHERDGEAYNNIIGPVNPELDRIFTPVAAEPGNLQLPSREEAPTATPVPAPLGTPTPGATPTIGLTPEAVDTPTPSPVPSPTPTPAGPEPTPEAL